MLSKCVNSFGVSSLQDRGSGGNNPEEQQGPTGQLPHERRAGQGAWAQKHTRPVSWSVWPWQYWGAPP